MVITILSHSNNSNNAAWKMWLVLRLRCSEQVLMVIFVIAGWHSHSCIRLHESEAPTSFYQEDSQEKCRRCRVSWGGKALHFTRGIHCSIVFCFAIGSRQDTRSILLLDIAYCGNRRNEHCLISHCFCTLWTVVNTAVLYEIHSTMVVWLLLGVYLVPVYSHRYMWLYRK